MRNSVVGADWSLRGENIEASDFYGLFEIKIIRLSILELFLMPRENNLKILIRKVLRIRENFQASL